MTTTAHAGYEAARSAAAFFPVSDGGRFRMLGPDAQDFLHRMVTNDIKSLTPGQGVYATILDINGRMTADLFAWLLDLDNILIETAASAQNILMATLDKYIIMEQVELEEARTTLALVTVQGPKAHELVEEAVNAPIPMLEPGEAWESGPDALNMVVGMRDRSGMGGVDIYVPADRQGWLQDALRVGGVPEGDPDTLETLRIEAGIPKWGHELDETVIPLEANLEGSGVSFTKGCYPGQEIIARIHSRGAPARHLAGIRFSDGSPSPGAEVLSGDQPIGKVTSAALSPSLGGLALAYLKKGAGDPGDAVTAGGLSGTVESLPFSTR